MAGLSTHLLNDYYYRCLSHSIHERFVRKIQHHYLVLSGQYSCDSLIVTPPPVYSYYSAHLYFIEDYSPHSNYYNCAIVQ